MKSKKVVAIIQARIGSSRLPGKVMAEIAGYPLIYHVIQRAKATNNVDEIIIATTTDKDDDVLDSWAKKNKVKLFRGPKDDVLARYFLAAQTYQADILVRICADSPLFDPEFTSAMIRAMLNTGADLVRLAKKEPSVHAGVSVFSFRALESAYINSKKPLDREHVEVEKYAISNPSHFKFCYVRQKKAFAKSGFRFSVDTLPDLELIRYIYERFYKNRPINLEDIIKFLEKNPKVKNLNEHVKNTGGKRPGFKICIITSIHTGEDFGYGHFYRMITLANTLRENFANGVKFFIEGDNLTKKVLRQNFIGIAKKDELKQFNAVIIDSHSPVQRTIFEKLNGPVKISYDDGINSRFADMSFFPFSPRGTREDKFCGLEYNIVKKWANLKYGKDGVILISADPADVDRNTLPILRKLSDLGPKNRVGIILRDYYKNSRRTKAFVARSPLFFVINDLSTLKDLVRVAICYPGSLIYELAFVGIPCFVYLAQDKLKLHFNTINSKNIARGIYDIEKDLNDFVTGNNLNNMPKNLEDGTLNVAKIIQKRLLLNAKKK